LINHQNIFLVQSFISIVTNSITTFLAYFNSPLNILLLLLIPSNPNIAAKENPTCHISCTHDFHCFSGYQYEMYPPL
jgi:hypothetical protein